MSENRTIAAMAVFFLVGIVLHLVPALSFIPMNITDFFLFLTNLIVFVYILKLNSRGAYLILFFASLVFTFLSEAAGVHTGKIFGIYHYGSTLKVQLLNVPLIIPFNWVMLVLGMTSIMQSFRTPSWLVPVLAALGLVFFDYTMEPVAVALDYWHWQSAVIPLQNYLAWFVIAWLISSCAVFFKIRLDKKILRYYVIIQWLFFLVLNLFFRYFDA